MKEQRIRIGFVGAGGIVRDRHIPNLQKIPGVEFISVCNRTRESSERAAKAFGIPKIHETWQELVHSDEINVVWIGTWPYLHKTVTLEALAAGKHVFCQARMAMNLAEACEMLDASERSNCVAMLCPPPMGLAGDTIMQELMKGDPFLGTIYSIHLRAMSGVYIDPHSPISWRQREDLSGVNTLTVGIYAEVIHRWFGYAKTVTAQAKTFIPERPTTNGELMPVTRPDLVFALCEMENGALLRCEWSGLTAPPPASTLEVYGSKGAVRYNFDMDEIQISRKGQPWEKIEIAPNLINEWRVEQDFIDAICTGRKVHPDFHDGMKYMEFTEAIFRSAETGKQIVFPFL
ncbi:MAG: gfo/Idh/MocA family oxidoreductase [Candidatus Omnitrophota bacterium]|jgi:predicted dehydrogenase|nr:MAG: gfo/Idh/MocA family oxidoreductase [Candidatus Omnitrophota bacterium]